VTDTRAKYETAALLPLISPSEQIDQNLCDVVHIKNSQKRGKMIRKIVTPIIIAIPAFCMGAIIYVIMKK